MDASKEARLKALEGIENAVRGHLLKHVGPELGHFLSVQAAAQREAANETLLASLVN